MKTARRCRLVAIGNLIPPDGRKIDKAEVGRIAESIKQCGILQPIVVVGRHILHGVHRWEAAKLAGLKHIEVIDAEKAASADENEYRVLVENVVRRHFVGSELDRMRQRLVDLKVPQIAQEMQSARKDSAYTRSFQKPKSAHGEAIRAVAKETGATEAAVKTSVARTAATERIGTAVADGNLDNLDEYQNPIPKRKAPLWEKLRKTHKELDQLMRRAQGLCSELTALGGEPASYGQRWGELAHTIGAESRSYSPYAVCPKCGGDERPKPCDLCRGVGFVCEGGLPRSGYEKLTGMSS